MPVTHREFFQKDMRHKNISATCRLNSLSSMFYEERSLFLLLIMEQMNGNHEDPTATTVFVFKFSRSEPCS